MVPLEHVEDRPAGHIDDRGDEPAATASRRRLHHGLIEADHRDRADPAGVIDTHLCDGSTPAHTVDHRTPPRPAINAGGPPTPPPPPVAPPRAGWCRDRPRAPNPPSPARPDT